MLSFRLFLEATRPIITSVSKYAGTVWVTVIIRTKKYVYHCYDNPRVWRIVRQMNVKGAEWHALNALKKEAESFETHPI